MNPNTSQPTGPSPQIAAAPQVPITTPNPQPQPVPMPVNSPMPDKTTGTNSMLTIFLVFGIIILLVISVILLMTILNH